MVVVQCAGKRPLRPFHTTDLVLLRGQLFFPVGLSLISQIIHVVFSPFVLLFYLVILSPNITQFLSAIVPVIILMCMALSQATEFVPVGCFPTRAFSNCAIYLLRLWR